MSGRRTFETAALPHLHAAYNLARWLTCDDQDAENVVHEAFMHALEHFDRINGQEERQWLLRIVRNTCHAWLEKHRPARAASLGESDDVPGKRVNEALEALPIAYREIIVMRDIEAMSYKEIAAIVASPVSAVLSRLAHGRGLLSRAIEMRRPLNQASKRDLSATTENSTNARTRAGRSCALL